MLDLWLTWCSQECCAIFLIFKNIFIVIIGVILQQNARFLGGNLTLTLFWYVTLTSDDLDTTTKQLAGHVLVINDTLYLIIHHLVRMLCTNLDCLCWLAAILDFRENRAFSMEGFKGIFNCGQEGYKWTDFRWEILYCNFVQPPCIFRRSFTRLLGSICETDKPTSWDNYLHCECHGGIPDVEANAV